MIPRRVRYPFQMALRRTAALAIAWFACVAAGPGASRLPDAAARAVERLSPEDVRAYVERLASDAMGGRGVGEPGNRAAEEFMAHVPWASVNHDAAHDVSARVVTEGAALP